MHTVKMVAPITGKVLNVNIDAVKYLRKAGWQDAPADSAQTVPVIKVGRVDNAERCSARAKLFHDAVKAEMLFSRLSERDAINRVLMA